MYLQYTRTKSLFIWIFPLFLLFFFESCKKEQQIPEEIASIPVHLNVLRFDQRFAEATADSLPILKEQFPYLFPQNYNNDFWVKKMRDTLQGELNHEVEKTFPDFEEEGESLESLFKHIEFYYPKTPLPTVVTVTSDVDYRNKVILTDTLLIVALDTYLGSDHKFYVGIQQYLTQNFKKEQISVDVASAFAEKVLGRPQGRRFLDEMIYQGKRLYIMEHLLTLEPKNKILSYTGAQWQWTQENEANIWTYFIDKKLLYSTDSDLMGRFINPAPFSKFQMEFDTESPPQLGRYIGWQIVSAYMQNNEVALQDLTHLPTDEIFQNANYKPKK